MLNNIPSLLLKFFAILAVFGILLIGFGVLVYSGHETFQVLTTMLNFKTGSEKVVSDALHTIDLLLLGVVIIIIGFGLFELFIFNIKNLPKWLAIKDLDQLKGMLVKVAIVVISISFTSKIVTWDGETDILGYGLGLGAVILALSYFLKVKTNDEGDKQNGKQSISRKEF